MRKLIFSVAAVALVFVFAVPALAAGWAGPEEMVATKTEILQERVEAGVISQEEADAVLEILQERAETCDGVPDENRERLGQTIAQGLGFGRNGQRGRGNGGCAGAGFGRGGNR